jgi:hypothetical protein
MVIGATVKRSHQIAHHPRLQAKPIAMVALGIDGSSPIPLPRIIKSHDIWVRDEGGFVFVLNFHGSPWKYETVVSGRARILKRRVCRMASKGSNSD